MDINYILAREQTSLHNALVATSSSARASHQGLATAYGRLLADSAFPHRSPVQLRFCSADESSADRWDDDGGVVSALGNARPPDLDTSQNVLVRSGDPSTADALGNIDASFSTLIRVAERNKHLLALQYSAGTVSARSFQTRSRFVRQDQERLAMMAQAKGPENAS